MEKLQEELNRRDRVYRSMIEHQRGGDLPRIEEYQEEFNLLAACKEMNLLEVANRFLRRKATIGELRAAVKVAR